MLQHFKIVCPGDNFKWTFYVYNHFINVQLLFDKLKQKNLKPLWQFQKLNINSILSF